MKKKLTFGYLYDFRNPAQWRKPWTDLYAETLDVIAWSESAGFNGAWLPEHHGAEDGYLPSPLMVLGAIAARTKTINIGSAIALAPLYHPVRFSEDCAVLDILCNGRLEMALAIGYRHREYDAFGLDFKKRGSRFDEFLQIVRALWRGETVNFAGKHFTIKNALITPPPPRGHVPLYIGGFADKALDRVAKYGDGYFGNEEFFHQYQDKLREQGKDASAARMRVQALFIAVAHDPEKAMHELAPYYHHVNNTYAEWINEDQAIGLDDQPLKPMDLDAFKKSRILRILTPDQAIAKFKAMQERIAVEHVMMMRPPGLPADRFIEYADIFSKEVLPAFQ